VCFFFFFSSRRRHTRWPRDWSSDVCSSDLANFTVIKASDGTYSVYLGGQTPLVIGHDRFTVSVDFSAAQTAIRDFQGNDITSERSEERRVGKEWRARRWAKQ